MIISLPVRFYQATPTSNPRGLVEETWRLDTARTAFVPLHCWNVGMEGGTPVPEEYWVDLGSPQNHAMGAAVLRDAIEPCLRRARAVGMTVAHVQSILVAMRYPNSWLKEPPSEVASASSPPPISNHASERASRVHGEGYMDWPGWDALDFPECVRPAEGEIVVTETDALDRSLRNRQIDTLLFAGFCTNLCILDSPAAMKAMAGRGYRCVLLREATAAVEFPDTLEQRINTQVAIRYIEAWVGYSASVTDLLAADPG
jgi:nicotinamidase-related amidase